MDLICVILLSIHLTGIILLSVLYVINAKKNQDSGDSLRCPQACFDPPATLQHFR